MKKSILIFLILFIILMSLFSGVATLTATEPPEINLKKADSLFIEKKYEAAKTEYLNLLANLITTTRNHPKIPYLMLQLAICCLETGEDLDGLRWLIAVITGNPKTPEATVAETWISSKQWFAIGQADGQKWFLDYSSKMAVENNIVRAFVKVVNSLTKEYDVMTELFDCGLHRMAIVGSIQYSSNGEVLRRVDTDTISWATSPSGSVGASLLRVVCYKDKE